MVNTGVKAFVRVTMALDDPNTCKYRLHNEVISLVYPFLSSARMIHLSKADVLRALKEEYPLIDGFSEEVRRELERLTPGGFTMAYFDEGETEPSVALSVLRAHRSINVLLAKADRKSLIQQLE